MSAYHPVCILHCDKWRWPCWWLCAWVWAGFARPHLHCASVMTKSVFHCCCFLSKPTEYFFTTSDNLSHSFGLLSLHRLLLVFGRRHGWDFIGCVNSRGQENQSVASIPLGKIGMIVNHRMNLGTYCMLYTVQKETRTQISCLPTSHSPTTHVTATVKRTLIILKRWDSNPPVNTFKALETQVLQRHVSACRAQSWQHQQSKVNTFVLSLKMDSPWRWWIPVKYVQGFYLWKQPYISGVIFVHVTPFHVSNWHLFRTSIQIKTVVDVGLIGKNKKQTKILMYFCSISEFFCILIAECWDWTDFRSFTFNTSKNRIKLFEMLPSQHDLCSRSVFSITPCWKHELKSLSSIVCFSLQTFSRSFSSLCPSLSLSPSVVFFSPIHFLYA